MLQRISGVVLLAGLALHFYTMHFSGPENLTHEAVMRRFSDPLWIAFNAAFLVSVVYHGFSGLWGIAIEYVHTSHWLRAVKAFLLVSACVLTATGFYILTLS